MAHTLAIAHSTLPVSWSQPPFPPLPPPHATENSARTARFLLLKHRLEKTHINHLWMAHHRDDQVENRLLWGGGRQMPYVARFPGGEWDNEEKWIVRPFLGFEKVSSIFDVSICCPVKLELYQQGRLLATCKEYGLPYIIDPTNLDPNHTQRNGLRHSLALFQKRHAEHPFASNYTLGGPGALLSRVSSIPVAPPQMAKLSLKIKPHLPCPGTLSIDVSSLSASTSPAAQRGPLRTLVHFVAPEKTAISNRGIELVREKIFSPSLSTAKRSFAPGGGVIFTPIVENGRTSKWIVSRQPCRAHDNQRRTVIENGKAIVWDGRLRIRIESEASDKSWTVEESGRWCAPIVVQHSLRNASTLPITFFGRSGIWEGEQVKISWRWKRWPVASGI